MRLVDIMENEKNELNRALRHAGDWITAILQGLNETGLETRAKIMELCGKACAVSHGELKIAERIISQATDEEEILTRLNAEIPWCGIWSRHGNTIQSECSKCGCPLVRNSIIELSETLCLCSRGWVKMIFEVLLKMPVKVELEKAIGRGDNVCRFIVHSETNQ